MLNLTKGWAFCIDLDERIGEDGVNPSLAVSPDGSTLYASDGSSGLTATIDTATLKTRRVSRVSAIAPLTRPYAKKTAQVARTAGSAAAIVLPASSSGTSMGVASCGSSERACFSPMTDCVARAIGTMAGMMRK